MDRVECTNLELFTTDHPSRVGVQAVRASVYRLLWSFDLQVLDTCLTGSAFCTTAEPNDFDVVLLVADHSLVPELMQEAGLASCSDYPETLNTEDWSAWRDGRVNVICTDDAAWFKLRWVEPSYEVLKQNPQEREQRVALHEAGQQKYNELIGEQNA